MGAEREGLGVFGRGLASAAVAAVFGIGLAGGGDPLAAWGLGEISLDPQLLGDAIQGAFLVGCRRLGSRAGPTRGLPEGTASTGEEPRGMTPRSSPPLRAEWSGTRTRVRVWGRLLRRCLPPIVALTAAFPALGASARLAGQAPLDRPARLDVDGVGVEPALRLLRRNAGVALIYSPDLIPADREVTCRCESITVRQALQRILSGTGLTFRGSERQIRIVPEGSPAPTALTAVVSGIVMEAGGAPIVNALIRLEAGRHVFSDTAGAFTLGNLIPGMHRLTVSSMGWRTRILDAFEVAAGDTVRLTVVLDPSAIELAELRVAPGTFSALEEVSPEPIQLLTREEILTMPQVGEDIFRSMKRLPGVASHDISTKLHIRGGTDREVLVRLDGVELYEPYHMKDWDGALGIVDLNALGGVELSAGGFGVEHGNKATGIFDMRSRTAVGAPRTTLGLSITNLTAMSRGGFAGDRGSWLVSARRGFMGLVIRLIGEDERLSPQYWDAFGKVSYQPAPGHLVSAHVLHAGDSFGLHGLDGLDRVDVDTDWQSSYGWVAWERRGQRVSSDLTAWGGRVTRDRVGVVENTGRPGMPHHISALDDRTFSFGGVREELSVDLGERALIKLGGEARRLHVDYAYAEGTWTEELDQNLVPVIRVDTTDLELERDGIQTAAWAALRARPLDRLTVEAGVRYDRVTHARDEDLAPRILGAFDLDSLTTLRGSWGRYHQSHGIHELEVADGEVEFHTSERSDQIALGLERRLPFGITARAEMYSRTIEDQRPNHLNLEQELEIFPEAEGDRLRIDPARGRARGLELSVERNGRRWAWSVSYVLSRAEDEVPDLFAAECAGGTPCSDRLWIPRRFDQRHAAVVHAAYTPDPRWTIAFGWRYHSGWPATEWSYRVEQLPGGRAFWVREFGPVRELRLPAYHRLDVRVTRDFRLGGNPLRAYLDLFNLYDRTNLAGYEFGGTFMDGAVVMERRDGQTLLPFLPTFGLRYEF